MPRIVWTEEAISHLEAITAYISIFNPAAAERLGERLIAAWNDLGLSWNRRRSEVGPADSGTRPR